MDFKTKAIETNKIWFFVRECSICKYPLAYEVLSSDFNLLGFDCGCDCTSYKNMSESSWEEMERFYNAQSEETKRFYDRSWWGKNEAHEHE